MNKQDKINIKNAINSLDTKREEIKDIVQQLLRDLGWDYKTSEIDCYWYWYKRIGKVTYALSEDNALDWAIRQFQDENNSLYPEGN